MPASQSCAPQVFSSLHTEDTDESVPNNISSSDAFAGIRSLPQFSILCYWNSVTRQNTRLMNSCPNTSEHNALLKQNQHVQTSRIHGNPPHRFLFLISSIITFLLLNRLPSVSHFHSDIEL
jgi:uncharacterized membrane protein